MKIKKFFQKDKTFLIFIPPYKQKGEKTMEKKTVLYRLFLEEKQKKQMDEKRKREILQALKKAVNEKKPP